MPATSFCEWTDTWPKVAHWFALDESRPLFAFAGIWRLWTGERKGETGEHQLFAFLTTESNDVVRPIHSKAMPVLLTKAEDWETWLTGAVDEATALQKPLPNDALRIVAMGEKTDSAPHDPAMIPDPPFSALTSKPPLFVTSIDFCRYWQCQQKIAF